MVDMLNEYEKSCLVLASDGLFEVLDNEEIGKEVLISREKKLSAEEVAKKLCNLALKKGSFDNISVIIVFFD